MTMNRRAYSATLVAGAVASLISMRGVAANLAPTRARNAVLARHDGPTVLAGNDRHGGGCARGAERQLCSQ